jgi:hypothetical protein
MPRRFIFTWLVFALASIAPVAPTALAASAGNAVVVDCTSHNRLTQRYSAAQLRDALLNMSVDVKEYTACPDIIQRALDTQQGNLSASSGGNPNSGGGAFLPAWLIVVLVILLVGGASFGALALRRRGTDPRE